MTLCTITHDIREGLESRQRRGKLSYRLFRGIHADTRRILYWASKENSTHKKVFMFGHSYPLSNLTHLKNKGLLEWKRREMRWNRKKPVKKRNAESACLPGWEFSADKNRYGLYLTRHWNLKNNYWIFWIGCLCGVRSVSCLCDFWKKEKFAISRQFSSFWHTCKPLFFRWSYEGAVRLIGFQILLRLLG